MNVPWKLMTVTVTRHAKIVLGDTLATAYQVLLGMELIVKVFFWILETWTWMVKLTNPWPSMKCARPKRCATQARVTQVRWSHKSCVIILIVDEIMIHNCFGILFKVLYCLTLRFSYWFGEVAFAKDILEVNECKCEDTHVVSFAFEEDHRNSSFMWLCPSFVVPW